MIDTIKGHDILEEFPFEMMYVIEATEENPGRILRHKGVSGWGQIHLPAISGMGTLLITSVAEVYFYIEEFEDTFGEEPVFVIQPDKPWFSKIKVVNEAFLKRQGESDEVVNKWLKILNTTE